MATRPEQLYKNDFHAWTRDQAQALRRLAAERWNGPLDLEHLAEEVESLGSEQQWALESQLERVIEHLLKLEHSSNADPRRQWMISVVDARGEIERRMTATIPNEVEPSLSKRYRRGRRKADLALAAQGEKEAARALPSDCPYRFDDLIADEWWPINRHGLRDDD
jgi:regulator of protease activity HflC (stomatin/prohibitin superfamily)